MKVSFNKVFFRNIILITLSLWGCNTLQAQLYIGGNIGFAFNNYNYHFQQLPAYNKDLPRGYSFEVSPRLGYQISDKILCGVTLGVSHSQTIFDHGFYSPLEGQWVTDRNDTNTQWNYGGGLFVRYQIHSFGRLSLLAELSGTYSMGFGTNCRTDVVDEYPYYAQTISDARNTQLQLQVVPVFLYDLGNGFYVDLYLNFASVIFQRNRLKTTGIHTPNMQSPQPAVDLTDYALDLGIHSQNTQLLSIGFSYRFK